MELFFCFDTFVHRRVYESMPMSQHQQQLLQREVKESGHWASFTSFFVTYVLKFVVYSS